jgi:hypothetical protein
VLLDVVLKRIRFCHLYFEVKLKLSKNGAIRFSTPHEVPAGYRSEGEWLIERCNSRMTEKSSSEGWLVTVAEKDNFHKINQWSEENIITTEDGQRPQPPQPQR